MVAIVSGMTPGLNLSSREVLGAAGMAGNPAEGRSGQSVYVNAASGQLTVQNQDELLVGRGLDAALVRTYNSAGTFNDDNGDHWSSSVVSLRLAGAVNTAGSTIQRVDGDGSIATYRFDAEAVLYVTDAGAGARDTIDWMPGAGQFEWRDGSTGTVERYEDSGAMRLLSRKGADGNALLFAYGPDGYLASVTTANGEVTYYDYSGTNLAQVRTVAGGVEMTRVRYTYDSADRLTNVRVDLTPEDNASSDGALQRTIYTYDGDSHRIASITQGTTQLFFTYQDAGGGDYRVASVTDALGHTSTFAYGSGFMTVTDALGLVTRYQYDGQGQLTRITAPAVSGVAASRSFAYDERGNVTLATDGAGRSVLYEYDEKNNRLLQRDELGNTVRWTYSDTNQVLTERVYAQPDPDGAGPELPTAPLSTRYVYDNRGGGYRLRFVVGAEGRVTEHRYDDFGQRVATLTYAAGTYDTSGLRAFDAPTETQMEDWAALQDRSGIQRVGFSYDGRGQLQSRTTYAAVDGLGRGIEDGSQSVERFVYDRAGRLLQSVSATGGTAHYTYDGLGRVTSSTDALGRVTVTEYRAGSTTVRLETGLVTTSAYDAAGRLTAVTQSDSGGVVLGTTTYTYDSANRLRMTQDPTGLRSWMLYDEAGRKTADVDANGRMTEYVYDRSDRLVQTITYGNAVTAWKRENVLSALPDTSPTVAAMRPQESASDFSVWRAYDAAGRLVRVAEQNADDGRAVVTETHYDAASRVLSVVRHARTLATDGSPGSVAPGDIRSPVKSEYDRTTRNFHDAEGRLVGTLDAEGYLTVFRYNGAGQLAERRAYARQRDPALWESGTLYELTPRAADAHDQVETTLYDGKGRVAGVVDAEGYLTETVRDDEGRVTRSIRYAKRVTASVSITSSVDAIRPADSPSEVTQRSYDGLGQLVTETSSAGVVTRYTYDAGGRLVSTTAATDSTEARTLRARYDLQGRLVAELSAEGAARIVRALTDEEVEAIWASYGTFHTYDAAGRRTSTSAPLGQRTWYFYNDLGALTHTVNALGEVQEARYDTRGRVTDRIAYAGRLATAGLAGGLVTSAFTDAVDAIANSTLDTRTRITYTRDGQVESTTDAAGLVTTHGYNVFGDEVARTLSGTEVALTESYTVDHRGLRTSEVRDPAGLKVETSSEYDAFGRLVRSVDANGQVRQQAYDRLGRIVTTYDPLNGKHETSYDAVGRVLTRTDALGNETSYVYDAATRTLEVTTPEGVVTKTAYTRHGQVQSITDGKGQGTTYQYDRNGNLEKTITPLTETSSAYDVAGRLAEATDANGNTVAYSYDAANRVLTRTVDPEGLNLTTSWAYKGRQVSETDANGVVTTTTYSRAGRVLRRVVDPGGLELVTEYTYDASGNTLTVTSPNKTVTKYGYDALGRRVQEWVDPTGLDLRRSWTYDGNGNVLSATDPLGNVTRYAYDADNRLVYTLGPLGNVRRTGYDAEGRVVKTTAYAKPIDTAGLGEAPSPAEIYQLLRGSPQDVVENRLYDRDGRLAATVDGTGAAVRYEYDKNGNVIARTAFATPTTWVAGTELTTVADSARDETVRTVYDALNRAIYTVDGVGAVVEQVYDDVGNVLRRTAYATPIPTATEATQAKIAAAVAGLGDTVPKQTLRHTYDAANRLVWTVNGVGAVTQRRYDGNGNVVQQVAYATPVAAAAAPASVVASSGDRSTSMAYDAANRLVFSVDALGAVTEQLFGANGNVVQRIAYAKALAVLPPLGTPGTADAIRSRLQPDEAADRCTRYGYDKAGRLAMVFDATGAATGTEYDAAGRAVAVTAYAKQVTLSTPGTLSSLAAMQARVDPDNALNRTTRYAYDGAGRLVYTVSPVGTAGQGAVTGGAYDGTGRLTRSTRYSTTIAAGSATSAAAIAAAITAATAAEPGEVRTDSYTYDAAGRVLSNTNALGDEESYTYDALGRKLTFTNRKGATWAYEYDAAGRLVKETSPEIPRTWVDGHQPATLYRIVTRMAYDALGNLTQRTEAAGRPEERTTKYEYDALGRQVGVTYSQVEVYRYGTDTVESTDLETHTYYDTLGNAVANRDVGSAVSQKTYDRVGRVEYEIDALGYVTKYTRNAFGEVVRLTRIASPTGLTAQGLVRASDAKTSADVEAVIDADTFDRSRDRTITTEYDRAGRVTETREVAAYVYDADAEEGEQVDTAARTTRNTYNAFGQLVETRTLRNVLADKWATTTRYFDRAGRETAVIDAGGYLTQRSYDSVGNVTRVVEYARRLADGSWTIGDHPAPVTSDEDRETTYAYDRLNRKTAETRVGVEYGAGTDGTSTRGDLVTTFGYDALGNQTRVTDANGGITRTEYDALGRTQAIAAPARTVASGETATPLTRFQYDAHGNLTVKTEYAGGATPSTFTPVAPDAADRITRFHYDRLGRVDRTTDALGNIEFRAYDAYGHLAKKWQTVTDSAGNVQTTYEINEYDRVGQLIATRTPGSAWVYQATTGVTQIAQADAAEVKYGFEYNGFGELTAKTRGAQTLEYYDYDTAGRLWRTNSGDGVDRIYLYDLHGNVTADIRSAGAGLSNRDITTITSAKAADGIFSVRRVDTTYDLLGRVTGRTQPLRREIQDGVTALRQEVTASAVGPTYLNVVGDGERVAPSTNKVTLTWSSLASLGSGEVKVYLEYHPTQLQGGVTSTSPETRTYTSEILDGGKAAQGTVLDWDGAIGQSLDTWTFGISQVTRIVVYKKNSIGDWKTVIDQAPGAGGKELRIDAPDNPRTGVKLELRTAGSTDDTAWWAAPLTYFGDQYRYNASSLAAGKYEYRVTVDPVGEVPRVVATGVVTVTSTVTQAAWTDGDDRWLRPRVEQKTDRWGNVVEMTDPRSVTWKTTYRFNASNQLVEQVQPDAAGRISDTSPRTRLFYDKLGRQVAVKDANGNLNRQAFDQGGNLKQETHADGGIVRHAYDIFGQKVQTTDAMGNEVGFTYDKLGRMLTMSRGSARLYEADAAGAARYLGTSELIDRWTYDELGRRVSHTNGAGETLTYTYDVRGNLVQTHRPLGKPTRAAYDAQGRKTAEVDPNGNASRWTYDYFGQLQRRYDLAGVLYEYTYDHARQLTEQTSGRGQSISYGYDAAGQMKSIRDLTLDQTTRYTYDEGGRRVREKVVQKGVTYQDNRLAYDTRGNLRDVSDSRVHLTMEYDAVGNRTRVSTAVNYQGETAEATSRTDRYFQYDAMDRQVVVDAVDAAGALGKQGHRITYDKNGNRKSDVYWGNKVTETGGDDGILYYDADGFAVYGTTPKTFTRAEGNVTEQYEYDAQNRLRSVVRDGWQIDARWYDAADRLVRSGASKLPVEYAELINTGLSPEQSNGLERRINGYDANGRLVHQVVRKSNGVLKAEIAWEDRTLGNGIAVDVGGYDQAGNVAGYAVWTPADDTINTYKTAFRRFDGYQAWQTSATSNKLEPATTTQEYDVNGFLVGVTDTGEPRKNRKFVNDAAGRTLYVEQEGNIQRQLIVNGEVLGRYGVGVDPVNPADSEGAPNYANSTDFNFGYSPITANYPNASPGTYEIRTGDSLQSIAQAAYGDSSLWYRIAEANGLDSNDDLRVGQTLNIPNRVGTVSNNNTTFKPYDPTEIQGDMTPTLSPPKGKEGCGGAGQLLMLVVAIAVSLVTAGAGAIIASGGTLATATLPQLAIAGIGGMTGAFGAGVVAVSAAAGSLASQAVGVATGVQDRISWKGVALSAVSAGFSAGLQAAPIFTDFGPFAGVARAVTANVLTQGVGVAVGLQSRFDWRGVAASAVGTGVGEAVSSALNLTPQGIPNMSLGEYVTKRLATSLAATTAAALARGGRVEIQQVAIDAFGNALGESLASASQPETQAFGPNSGIDYRNGMDMDMDSDNWSGSGQSPSAWNSGSLPELYEKNFGAGAQQVDFRRKNGEYVQEFPSGIVGNVTEIKNAPLIPDHLLPEGVDARTVAAARDEAGNIWYGMPGAEPRHADLFFNTARAIVGQGSQLLDAGVITPSQYLETVRYLQESGVSLDSPTPQPSRVEVSGVGLAAEPSMAQQAAVTAVTSIGQAIVQLPLMGVDVVQAAGGAAYTEITGRAADLTMYSGVGRAAESGVGTTELLHNLNPVYAGLVAQHDIRAGLALGDTRPLAAFSGSMLGGAIVGAGIGRVPGYQSGPTLSGAAASRLRGMGVPDWAVNPSAPTLVQRVAQPNPFTGEGYGVNNPGVRIGGAWSKQDYFNALMGRTPKGLGRPDLHHADQMPGSAIHEVLPGEHRGNKALHPNGRINQGVTSVMRKENKELHWWYRAREQGADQMYPDWIYD